MRSSRAPMADSYQGPDPARIKSMFRDISPGYDRANQILSAGVHHLWRRAAVRVSGAKNGDAVLDCATGTGDLAIAFKKRVQSGRVVGTDFVPEMVELAKKKASNIEFEVADVTNLPYPNDTFDVASISFGIRNVGDPRRGISELARVIKPGGRVLILEFGQPRSRAFGAFYDFYRKRILPRLGGALTGNRDAYDYLESSTARFPSGDDFAAMMRESAPFETITMRPLTFGIAWLYCGIK
ncbi:MAG TPA: bifunctional demethylmenaquinone methyltransferase/2-methoxy-6-polyprenyl-1,4-benzoquinol methylase UbiE [Thermoanaerobaculia bacterium]|nr:bifunctional demethylmenaquinone methyltransferase/2-methoxy-6-polyprenyl-1,4-benzoquinol methylase UbiE [Thermoanaerobaculia bacterium]